MHLKWWPLLLLSWSWNIAGELKNRRERQVIGDDQEKSIRIQDDTVMTREERLECYVCSWSIGGIVGPGNSSAEYDICSTGNFVRDIVSVVPCEHGCQSVSLRSKQKDEIRRFYRNCLKKEDGREIEGDRCYNVETVYGLEQRCECLSNLCNGSTVLKFSVSLYSLFVILCVFRQFFTIRSFC